MSGIAGLINSHGEPIDPGVISHVSERLRHRGPQGEGVFNADGVGFVQRRRLLFTREKSQPLVREDAIIMMDGRLYDHVELARASGVQHPGADPCETLYHLWKRWGIDAIPRLHGAFSVAIWDRREKTLYLVRDRMGVRPLFWSHRSPNFAFSSEIPSLLQVPWISRDINHRNIAEYLSFRVVHAPRTLLKHVHQVEPAHWLRFSDGQIRSERYWKPFYAPRWAPAKRESIVIPELQDAVQQAVKRRLPPGVKTGLYLSGGLGSSAIAASAKELHRSLPSFTVRFSEENFPESPIAGRVAKLLQMEHHEVLVGSADLAAAFDDGIEALGHPVGNPAAFLQLLLARAAAKHVQVVLSGDGGDELFGGRMLDRFARYLRYAERFSRLPKPVRQLLSGPLSRSARGQRVITPIDNYGLSLGIGGTKLFRGDERAALLTNPEWVRPNIRHSVLAPFYKGLDTDPVNAALYAYLRSWLGEESLTRSDRTAAAAGLSIYYPLLDQDVMSIASSLPGSFKLRRGGSLHTRWPLQAMLGGILPPVLVNRPKRGLPTPLAQWLVGPGRLFFEARFVQLKANPYQLFNQEELNRLYQAVGRSNGAGVKMWVLFQLDAWLRKL